MDLQDYFSEQDEHKDSGPVTCLGMTFENDEERRKYFTEKLREHLKDPEFRKIEGFPIGEDEDILALSDPPYYTACPNPWIGDFINEWESEKPAKPEDYHYHREPFVADITEGKTDQFYRAHSYHTKVPHKAIMRYILHYTDPSDIIFDGFCGSGMVGIAAQMCGSRDQIQQMGYKVSGDVISVKEEDNTGQLSFREHSKIGTRFALLNDLSPYATFISSKYNNKWDVNLFELESRKLFRRLSEEIGWMYETNHTDINTIGIINYTVWSEVFFCGECGNEIIFLEHAFDFDSYNVLDEFACPHCSASCNKNTMSLIFEKEYNKKLNDIIDVPKRVPVLINYSVGNDTFEKKPDEHDLDKVNKINNLELSNYLPVNMLPDMQMANVGRMKSTNTKSISSFFLKRQAHAMSTLWDLISKIDNKEVRTALYWTVEQSIPGMSVLNRYQPIMHGKPGGSQVNRQMSGVFYVPSQISECSPWYNLEGKFKRVMKAFSDVYFKEGDTCVFTGDCSNTQIPDNSIDYIFTDPPFGENIYYSDLNYLYESFHKVFTNANREAIVDKVRNKTLTDYHKFIESCFKEYYRILKPGKWITVEFSNTKATVWNAIQAAIANAGFIISSVTSLDKKQGTFQAVNSPTAVKQDLVISAYKPNGGFEARFEKEANTEEGVWDFVRTYLKYLPIAKKQDNELIAISERDPRILFDQLVAYYVRKGHMVPISSPDFLTGLEQRFAQRDGMYFLADQVAEYDRKKMMSRNLTVLAWNVHDEQSAIEWLRTILKDKPQTTSDLTPKFMQEISGWDKTEKALELSELLDQNFLRYDGKEPVPEQIHAYLSTNWKEYRNLSKDDPALKAKAKDRWYLPDPRKAGDIEKLREKALLKEFDAYKNVAKFSKNDRFRTEALRAGFKKAWQDKDYNLIVSIAKKIPANILEEDPKLLMYYDQASTRLGD